MEGTKAEKFAELERKNKLLGNLEERYAGVTKEYNELKNEELMH